MKWCEEYLYMLRTLLCTFFFLLSPESTNKSTVYSHKMSNAIAPIRAISKRGNLYRNTLLMPTAFFSHAQSPVFSPICRSSRSAGSCTCTKLLCATQS